MKQGFDNTKYLEEEALAINERLKKFERLYLEVGGKLIDDFNASRILPGFKPHNKINILEKLKDKLEVIICINAKSIEEKRRRDDLGITYDLETIRIIKELKKRKIKVNSVVITMYEEQETAQNFRHLLESYKIKSYLTYPTKGYPTDIKTIVSDEGYGKNDYIKVTKPLIVVTGPGPSSGKLSTCLSQLYFDFKRGINVGYAKYETFPVWDLSINDPINLSYEAATANINDKCLIDSFHLEKYGMAATNYNRDLEVFPILKEILFEIFKKNIYYSPTDMGINKISTSITSKEIIDNFAKREILRRYLISKVNYKLGKEKDIVFKRIKLIMNKLGITENDFLIRNKALILEKKFQKEIAVLEINEVYIIGKEKKLLTASSALLLNALKYLAHIPDEMDLLSSDILKPIIKYKKNKLLEIKELIIILLVSSATNPIIKKALEKLPKLNNTYLHITYILPESEKVALRSLGINITSEDKLKPNYFNLEE